MAELKYLFQPLKIGTMEVKNRVVFPPMGPGFPADEEGCVTPQLTEYFVERARGGAGMLTLGDSAVHPSGRAGAATIALWDDKFVPALGTMIRAVHNHGAKFGIELMHGGVQSHLEQTMGPSGVPALAMIDAPAREMSVEEIEECVGAFGKAAERSAEAGFDFIEVHAAHGYLINEFLTPYFNRRNDEYGGSFDKRIRFLLDVVREIRNKVGDETPIGVRINGDDFLEEEGWTLADTCRLAPILEEEGVNYLSVSAGVYGALRIITASMYEEQGAFVYLAEEVKKHISIPVIAVGRIKSPIMADKIIMEGKADLVAMGRAQIADPELAGKAKRGETAEIRPCIAECRGCIETAYRQEQAGGPYTGITCAVNARVGREYLIKDIKDGKKSTARKVLVAGAGCAGLECARVAAFAGHKVIVCEGRGRIGGQLRWAAMMPKRQEIGDILPWYERQLNKLGVEVRLNTTVDEVLLDQINPEILVLATGVLPEVPLGYIKGLENVKDLELLMVDELLEEEKLTGDSVLVIGGDQIGLQVTDYLSEQGKRVYVTEQGDYFAEKMATNDRFYLRQRIRQKSVKLYRNVREIEILPVDEVWVVTDKGREKLPQIDTIVFASASRPNIFLAEVAERKGIETHIIGDAGGVAGEEQGMVLASIAGGYEAGRRI